MIRFFYCIYVRGDYYFDIKILEKYIFSKLISFYCGILSKKLFKNLFLRLGGFGLNVFIFIRIFGIS